MRITKSSNGRRVHVIGNKDNPFVDTGISIVDGTIRLRAIMKPGTPVVTCTLTTEDCVNMARAIEELKAQYPAFERAL